MKEVKVIKKVKKKKLYSENYKILMREIEDGKIQQMERYSMLID